jgi:hypothetical protein
MVRRHPEVGGSQDRLGALRLRPSGRRAERPPEGWLDRAPSVGRVAWEPRARAPALPSSVSLLYGAGLEGLELIGGW